VHDRFHSRKYLANISIRLSLRYIVRMLAAKMDTLGMGSFLDSVSKRHPDEFVIMVLDGAPSHRSGEHHAGEAATLCSRVQPRRTLIGQITIVILRRQIFDSLGAAISQAARGLKGMEENPYVHQSIVGWNWILKSL
jgi:hypothetical protein